MPDEQAITTENTEKPQFTPEQVTAMMEELDRLKTHQGKLLDETKTGMFLRTAEDRRS